MASTLREAGAGPTPMMRGATPALAIATTRARGVRPWRRAASSEATSSAQAPSFTPEALPAVTVPPSRNGVGSLASPSSVVWGRGCSSCSTVTGSPLRWGTVTGVISLVSRLSSIAAAARRWLR